MKKIISFFLGGIVLMSACTSEEIPSSDSYLNESDESPELMKAISIAEEMLADVEGIQTRSSKRTLKTIEFVLNPNRTRGEKDDIYIVNYTEGGFAIVSTDPERMPVCAFSPYGSLSMRDTTNNPGFKDYMDLLTAGVINPGDTTIHIVGPNPGGLLPYTPPEQAYGEVVLPPILPRSVATWSQSGPFNSQCPTIDGKNCVTGCLPLACTMLMSHYEWPEQYGSKHLTWENMKASHYSTDLHYIIKSVGDKNNLDAKYGLNSTGAYLSNAPRTFERMGYKKPSIVALGHLLSDLDDNIPVLVCGTNEDNSGHAWIIDGTYIYHYGSLGAVPGLAQTYYHTVWGWGGYCNGYYLYGDSVAYTPRHLENGETHSRLSRTYGGFKGIGKLNKK